MSHHHIRADKTCLNCGTHVADRYCPHCGQENLEPKETLGHLVAHFFNDVTHFDGMLFSTVKLLITRPGFLSEEYMKGRRADYLNPIRMFLFISFALFFVEFATVGHDNSSSRLKIYADSTTIARRVRDSIEAARTQPLDTIDKGIYRQGGNVVIDDDAWINRLDDDYGTVHNYDSVQKSLPAAKRDGWWRSLVSRRLLGIMEYTEKHEDTIADDTKAIAMHAIPKALFISIPLFAFILWLLYIRSRKHYYFVAHAIFTVHLYCAIYLLLLVTIPLDYVDNGFVSIISSLLIVLSSAIYLYVAMRRFYRQNHFKTILKYVILLLSSFIVFTILSIGVALNTILVLSSGGH